jgi:hypothetical protein
VSCKQLNPPCLHREACLSFCLVFWMSTACLADQTVTTISSRITSAWEYDDNVFEGISGKTGSGAGAFSLFSRLRRRTPSSATRLDFQLGYKAHHLLSDSDTLKAGDVLIESLSFNSEKRISRSWVMGWGGDLKNRNIYRKNSLNLLSEEGYTHGSGRFYLRKNLRGIGSLTMGYRYFSLVYETFRNFNYRSHNPSVKISRRLSGLLTGSLEYKLTRRRYRRLISVQDGNGGLIQLDRYQQDKLHQLDLAFNYSRGFVLNFIYSLQRNDSNNFGFSYWNNRVSLIAGKRLPLEVFLNAYLFFELRRYSDKTDEPILVELITEENDNNGWVLKLSRSLVSKLDASLTYSYYRNQSSIRDLNFQKNLLSLGLTYRF